MAPEWPLPLPCLQTPALEAAGIIRFDDSLVGNIVTVLPSEEEIR